MRGLRRAGVPWLVAGLLGVLPWLAACGGDAADDGGVTDEPGEAVQVVDRDLADPEVVEETTAARVVLPEEIPQGGFVGVDLSHHSGDVDWSKLLGDEVDFVYLKATEGNDAGDPRFLEHWRSLGELGVPRGAYHFYVTEDAPETQATFFLDVLSQAGVGPGDLVPVVDVELLGHGTQPGLPDRLATFLELVEDRLGVAPILYTAPHFWDSQFADTADRFSGYRLWVAEYGVDEPVIPYGWNDYTLWQWQGDADLPGVEKGGDLSRLHRQVHLEELIIPRQGPPGMRGDNQ